MTPQEFRAARVELGYTQAQLAEALGFKRNETICEIETGKRNPGEPAVRLLRLLVAAKRP